MDGRVARARQQRQSTNDPHAARRRETLVDPDGGTTTYSYDVENRLARVETRIVLEQLQTEGFYLQLPPEMPTEEEIKQRFSSIGPDRA